MRTSQVKALPPEGVFVSPARRGFPLTSARRPTSVASEADMKPGNRKGTNPGPPDRTRRTRRTRRTAIVLRTPPRVLNSTAANCGPPLGTKRPQVQILSPRPVPQVADLRECRALRATSHLPAIATEASGNKKEHEGTQGKAGADFDGQKNTRPPSTTWQTARHSRILGTVILRPQRRGLSGGTSAGQEPVPIRNRQARQGRDRQRAPPRRRIHSTLALSTQLNEYVLNCSRPLGLTPSMLRMFDVVAGHRHIASSVQDGSYSRGIQSFT